MQVVFLGVGEACDGRLGNTSMLVRTNSSCILLDCGFSVAHAVFSELYSANDLDAVWISHFHGDHFFSLPLLLLRLWESGRDAALSILGPPGIEDIVRQSVRLAYPSFWDKFTYQIDFRDLPPGHTFRRGDCSWRTAWTQHSRPNLGLRLDEPGASLYYSGDGRPGDGTWDLAQSCSLIVHEGFQVDQAVHGHGTVRESVDLAVRAGAGQLAVVHMQRDEREARGAEARSLLQAMPGGSGVLPRPGDRLSLGC
jgi:ribonuclease BN (tRNA processing enzyme)